MQESCLLPLWCLPVRLSACKDPGTVGGFSLDVVIENFTKIMYTHSDHGQTRTTITDASHEAFLRSCRTKPDKNSIRRSKKCFVQMQR
jgi:hypothetical protein